MISVDPSSLPRGPRRFVAFWIADLYSGFNHRGFLSLIPLAFLFSIFTGAAISYFAKPALWSDMQNAIALYAAILAVNAILLAVCWAAFARLLDTLSEGEFGAWVRLNKQDAYYAFYIEYIHVVQIVAVTVSAVGLISATLPIPEICQRIALGATLASSLFAGRWSAGCVRIMQDLTDLRAQFRERKGGNVAPISSGRPA